jgi:hypothetical protein
VVELIEQRPREIAWVYVKRQRRGAIVIESIVIRGSDGKAHSFALSEGDAQEVMAEIARRAPHAARGYSAEKDKLFRENPARWRPAA